MNFLLGYIFLLIILFAIFLKFKKYPEVKKIILIAFILRAILLIIYQSDLVILPDSNADSLKFEQKAKAFSRIEGFSVVYNFFKSDSFLISRIISIFYTIFGESKMMAQTISVGLGTASVYLVYQLCIILWDHRSANKAAWVVALFPTLILYSSLILREVYIVFFLLFGLVGIANFLIKNSFSQFFVALSSFYILTLFHGPMGLGGLVFVFYIFLMITRKQLICLSHLKINITYLFIIIISSIPLILYLTNNLALPYIGSIEKIFFLEKIINKINVFIQGSASYPRWFLIENTYEFFTKVPLKIIYFIYAPFLWDLKRAIHVIGFFDAMLYLILTLYMIKNWNAICSNSVTRIFFLILVAYLIVYGIGVGNFGTGIRHRSKFIVIFVILAAPKIQKFIFSFKKKLYKH